MMLPAYKYYDDRSLLGSYCAAALLGVYFISVLHLIHTVILFMYMFTQINLILHSLFIWKWSTKYPIDCKRWTSLIPPWYGSRDKSCIHTKEATWSELVSKIPDFCEQIFKLLTSWRWGVKWLSLIPHQFIFFRR